MLRIEFFLLALLLPGVATADPLAFSTIRSHEGASSADAAYCSWVVRIYENDAGTRLALVLLLDPFDANFVSTHWDETAKDRSDRVAVTIDGIPFSSDKTLTCFVNGPYGPLREIAVAPDELNRLEIAAGQSGTNFLKAWQATIEPRLFKVEGTLIDGARNGTWIYYLNGKCYVRKGVVLPRR